jgi:ribosomal protein S17
MDTEQFHQLQDDIRRTIQEKVNGKIERMEQKMDIHNQRHEADMKDIKPIIEAFDASKTGGKVVLWLATAITLPI